MKRIASHVNSYCPFCKAEGVDKVKAIWRLHYISDRACEHHKQDLRLLEDRRKVLDSHYTEADYQTWMRL